MNFRGDDKAVLNFCRVVVDQKHDGRMYQHCLECSCTSSSLQKHHFLKFLSQTR